jgi:hypothetical protein
MSKTKMIQRMAPVLPNLQLLHRHRNLQQQQEEKQALQPRAPSTTSSSAAAAPPASNEVVMVDGLDTSFCENVDEARNSLRLPPPSSLTSREDGDENGAVTADSSAAAAAAVVVVPDTRSVAELLLAYFGWLQWLLKPENAQRR